MNHTTTTNYSDYNTQPEQLKQLKTQQRNNSEIDSAKPQTKLQLTTKLRLNKSYSKTDHNNAIQPSGKSTPATQSKTPQFYTTGPQLNQNSKTAAN